jgi:hypothetical protein
VFTFEPGRLIEGIHFRTKLFLFSSGGYGLVTTLSWSKVAAELVEGATESLGGSKAFKTQHGIVTLFEAAVVLLDPIIFVAATPIVPIENVIAEWNQSLR